MIVISAQELTLRPALLYWVTPISAIVRSSVQGLLSYKVVQSLLPVLSQRKLAIPVITSNHKGSLTMLFQEGQKTYVIAEIGANHNGDIDLARKMIDCAKNLGCDCVKFQSWDTSIFSKKVYEDNYFLNDDYRGRNDYTLEEIVREFSVSPEELAELKAYSDKKKIDFTSTPFEHSQIDDLVSLNAPFIKIASMDLNNDYLLRHAADTGKTILLSTGFGTMAEIDHAVGTIESTGNTNIVILHCVSMYPPRDDQVNLNNMDMLSLIHISEPTRRS